MPGCMWMNWRHLDKLWNLDFYAIKSGPTWKRFCLSIINFLSKNGCLKFFPTRHKEISQGPEGLLKLLVRLTSRTILPSLAIRLRRCIVIIASPDRLLTIGIASLSKIYHGRRSHAHKRKSLRFMLEMIKHRFMVIEKLFQRGTIKCSINKRKQ